jgi:hypothetical protein
MPFLWLAWKRRRARPFLSPEEGFRMLHLLAVASQPTCAVRKLIN